MKMEVYVSYSDLPFIKRYTKGLKMNYILSTNHAHILDPLAKHLHPHTLHSASSAHDTHPLRGYTDDFRRLEPSLWKLELSRTRLKKDGG